MPGEIYMAAAAAIAYEKRLEVIANNLANVNTAGFKRDEVALQEMTRTIEITRAFEAYQKTIVTVMDDVTAQTVRLGRVA